MSSAAALALAPVGAPAPASAPAPVRVEAAGGNVNAPPVRIVKTVPDPYALPFDIVEPPPTGYITARINELIDWFPGWTTVVDRLRGVPLNEQA